MYEAEFTIARVERLLRFARVLTGDRVLAEDIVQDVVLRLLSRQGQPVLDVDAYARRMIVNDYTSWRRRLMRQRAIVLLDERTSTGMESDVSERHAAFDELRGRLSLLSRKQRAAIVLRYFSDQTDEEIASILGCSPNAVRLLVSRGLAALRRQDVNRSARATR